jgi:probable addiction module antidote protein
LQLGFPADDLYEKPVISKVTKPSGSISLALEANVHETTQTPAKILNSVAFGTGRSSLPPASFISISRESLYRALSPKGNPTLKTLLAVLKTVGLRLSVQPGHVVA